VTLREVISNQGVFNDSSTKLLVFTEHKDTLDYLVDKLTQWGLSVTQIHGGMKIGDRTCPEHVSTRSGPSGTATGLKLW